MRGLGASAEQMGGQKSGELMRWTLSWEQTRTPICLIYPLCVNVLFICGVNWIESIFFSTVPSNHLPSLTVRVVGLFVVLKKVEKYLASER